MQPAQHFLRSIQAASGRGWLVLALVVLWAQFVSAVHHHGETGDVPDHRVWSCDLCIAQSAPAAPPPEPVLVRVPLTAAPDSAVRALDAPALTDRPVPQAPRAPPSPRRA